jgi:hypothetical protein
MHAAWILVAGLVACGHGTQGLDDAALQDAPDLDAARDAQHPTDAAVDTTPPDASEARDITAFSFLASKNQGLASDVPATIVGTTITVVLPFTNVALLTPTFTTTGSSVQVAGVPQMSGVTTNDFSTTVSYMVVAADGETRTFDVTVTAPGFRPRAEFEVSFSASSVVVADFNLDGKPDIASTDGYGDGGHPGGLFVLMNRTLPIIPFLNFAPADEFTTATHPRVAAAADLNADGKVDLVTSNITSDLDVFMNTTAVGALSASFTSTVVANGNVPNSVAVGDLNGDGKPDLAVANPGANTVSVYLNTSSPGGLPTFSAKTDITTKSMPYWVALADLNADGLADLAIAHWGDPFVSVVLNTTPALAATPSFESRVDFPVTGSSEFVACGDIDRDGKPDLVVVDDLGGKVSVLLDRTPASASVPVFAPSVEFPAAAYAHRVDIADLDQDGIPDLAIAAEGAILVMRGTTPIGGSQPSFAPGIDFYPFGGYSVATADLDADGRLDLVFGRADYIRTVSVLVGKP